MKLIALSKNSKNPLLKEKYFAQVDDADYEWLNQWNWMFTGRYAIRRDYRKGICETILMHRLVLGLTDPKLYPDHIDHNGINNQRNNLRVVNHYQNCMNSRKSAKSKHRFKGAYYKLNKNGDWYAKIQAFGKRYYLGNFKTEIEAALAYDRKAVEVHGEFAELNFKTT